MFREKGAFIAFDTKWRTHPDFVFNCDLVGVLCARARVELDFFRKADGQAGGRAGNDVTLSNYVRHNYFRYL